MKRREDLNFEEMLGNIELNVEKKEEIKEEKKEEPKMEAVKQQTALNAVITSPAFRKLEIELDSDHILNILRNKLGVEVLLLNTPFNSFFNAYLEGSKLTPAEKIELAKEYYPSAAVLGQGDGVKNLFVAKVPEVLVSRGEADAPLNWALSNTEIEKFVANHGDLFGSKLFRPAFKRIENGQTFYYLFISTTAAILEVANLDLVTLKTRNLLISVSDLVEGNSLGGVAVKYVLDIHLANLEK